MQQLIPLPAPLAQITREYAANHPEGFLNVYGKTIRKAIDIQISRTVGKWSTKLPAGKQHVKCIMHEASTYVKTGGWVLGYLRYSFARATVYRIVSVIFDYFQDSDWEAPPVLAVLNWIDTAGKAYPRTAQLCIRDHIMNSAMHNEIRVIGIRRRNDKRTLDVCYVGDSRTEWCVIHESLTTMNYQECFREFAEDGPIEWIDPHECGMTGHDKPRQPRVYVAARRLFDNLPSFGGGNGSGFAATWGNCDCCVTRQMCDALRMICDKDRANPPSKISVMNYPRRRIHQHGVCFTMYTDTGHLIHHEEGQVTYDRIRTGSSPATASAKSGHIMHATAHADGQITTESLSSAKRRRQRRQRLRQAQIP